MCGVQLLKLKCLWLLIKNQSSWKEVLQMLGNIYILNRVENRGVFLHIFEYHKPRICFVEYLNKIIVKIVWCMNGLSLIWFGILICLLTFLSVIRPHDILPNTHSSTGSWAIIKRVVSICCALHGNRYHANWSYTSLISLYISPNISPVMWWIIMYYVKCV